MNIASTETQHKIADIEGVADIAMHALEPRLVTRTAMTAFDHFINNCLPADPRNRRFACGVNIRHHHAISLIEGGAKLPAQRFGAGIAMRLKHGQHPFATHGSRSLQCSANFGGVMRVIVNKQKTIALILDLKPAPRVLEFTKRSRNFFERNSKL